MLEQEQIRAGHWEALWRSETAPSLRVVHLERDLPGLSVEPQGAGKWRLRLPIPSELLCDGVQSFVIRDGEETVGSFAIVTGAPLDGDLRAEIDLLRAELDLLKRAFRRHCLETGA